MELPSLMFFLRSSGRSIVSSFLRTIYRDLLFLLQIVIVFALLLIPAQPYTNTQIDLAAQHTVIVIDTSGSSQAIEDGQTRFERAIDAAEELIGKKTSIILAKGTPEIIIASASASEARTALRTVKPTDTTSRIGEAMFLADQVLQGDGRIVVLSDFDNTEGVSPTTAKTALEARGIPVAFVNTAQGALNNIGFIDIVVGEDKSTTYIRNFGTKESTTTLRVGDVTRELKIPAGGIEPFQFKTPSGLTDLKLETKDAYPADDILRVSAPDEAKIKVLLITNDKSKFLMSALTSSPRVDLSVSEPPIISKGDYDVYILHNLNPKDVLPGTFEDLLGKARKGAAVVVHAQQGMGVFKFGDLLPVELTGDGNNSYIRIDQDTTVTRNLELGNIKQYIQARARPGGISLASATDNSTMLTLKSEGAGTLVYYGIIESSSDFKLTPDYPIFWQNLVRVLARRADIRELNRKAGDTITTNAPIEGPEGTRLEGPVVTLEHRGIYTVGDRKIAVNNLDPRESALAYHKNIGAVTDAEKVATVKEERQIHWEYPLLIIASLFLFFELLFLKFRGDI